MSRRSPPGWPSRRRHGDPERHGLHPARRTPRQPYGHRCLCRAAGSRVRLHGGAAGCRRHLHGGRADRPAERRLQRRDAGMGSYGRRRWGGDLPPRQADRPAGRVRRRHLQRAGAGTVQVPAGRQRPDRRGLQRRGAAELSRSGRCGQYCHQCRHERRRPKRPPRAPRCGSTPTARERTP